MLLSSLFGGRVPSAVGSPLRPCEALAHRRSSPIRATAEKRLPKASGDAGEEVDEAHGVYLVHTYHVVVFAVDRLALHAGADEGDEARPSSPTEKTRPHVRRGLIGAC